MIPVAERDAPREIKPHLRSIEVPEELRSLPGWLIWRYEAHDGESKPRKVPYWTNGGRRYGVHGRPEDRANLTTFDAAKAAAARRGFDGVGLALMPEWGVTALDFDACVADTGLAADVESLVGHTYAEYSPSGRGVRAIVRGDLGNHRASGFETYSSKGFVTFTGNRLEITELLGNENKIGEITQELRALCQHHFGDVPRGTEENDTDIKPLGLTLIQAKEALDVLDPNSAREPWRDFGMALHHEFGGSDDAFDLWDEWSARSPKYPGRNALIAQWASFGKRDGRPVTARTLLKFANANGAHINLQLASPSDFEVIAETTQTNSPVGTVSDGAAQQVPSRFPVIPAGEFSRRPLPEYIIESVVPQAELMMIFGESGSGKTFVSLDIAMCIVRGISWRAYESKQGKVVYIAAEAPGGVSKRLLAYAKAHEVDLDAHSIGIIENVPNLLERKDAVDVARSMLAAMGKIDVVIVDTLAQVTAGGNENSGEDMGKALAHCKGIHKATGALVILIHHTGKDASKGARGWSGIRGACDAMLEVSQLPTGRKIKLYKQKDGEDGLEWGFALSPVNIGVTSRGAPITSCVVKEAMLPSAVGLPEGHKPGPVEQVVIDVLAERSTCQLAGIEVEPLLNDIAARLPAPEAGKRDTRKQRARRALMSLCAIEAYPYHLENNCIEILT